MLARPEPLRARSPARSRELLRQRRALSWPNVRIERRAAAVFQPELMDPESHIPSGAQRSYVACPLQHKLGVQMRLFKALGKDLAGLADEYIKLTS